MSYIRVPRTNVFERIGYDQNRSDDKAYVVNGFRLGRTAVKYASVGGGVLAGGIIAGAFGVETGYVVAFAAGAPVMFAGSTVLAVSVARQEGNPENQAELAMVPDENPELEANSEIR